MIETENQRRWWFATHPEFSHKEERIRKPHKESSGFSPEEVDRFVDEALKYQKNPVIIEILKATKRWFGTAGETPESYAELGLVWPGKTVIESDGDVRYEEPSIQPKDGPTENEKDRNSDKPTLLQAFAHGVNQVCDGWLFQIGLGTRDARELAQNLINARNPRPPGHAAHHIVPVDDGRFPEAIIARDLLNKFKINVNDAVNGVWLPYKSGITSGAYHPSIHTGAYYKEVVRLLKQSSTKEEAIETLKSIGSRLSKNTFPR